jgi:hypothetical protein
MFDLQPEVQLKLLLLALLFGTALVAAARRGLRALWSVALTFMVAAASAGLLAPRGFALAGGHTFGFGVELYPQWGVLAIGGVTLFLHGAVVIRLRTLYQLPASVLIGASLLRLGLGQWIV